MNVINNTSFMEYKVVLLGDADVGKTSLVTRFVSGQFDEQIKSTSAATYLWKMMEVDGKQIKLRLWDTAGQEAYRSLAPLYYRSAMAILLVFDVNSQKSFESLDYWMAQIKQNISLEQTQIIVACNKVDVRQQKCVSNEDAAEYCRKNNAKYYETSARTGVGVNDLFHDLAVELIRKYCKEENKVEKGTVQVVQEIDIEKQRKCC